MNRHALVGWIGSVLQVIVLAGCGGDDSDDEIGTGPSDATDESTEGVDDEVGESSTTDDGGESGGSASTTSTTGEDTDTTEDTDTDTNACPDNPDASACEACVLESCCEQLLACEDSESCSCMFDCVEEGGTAVLCLLECELDLPNLTYTQFTTCVQSMCLQECA
jgi:hypothetical protein